MFEILLLLRVIVLNIPSKMSQLLKSGSEFHSIEKRHFLQCVQAVNFQAVVIPSGLVANLYGPVKGWRHDAGMLKESGLLNILQRRAVTPTGDILCIYGDPAYPLRPHLMGLYRDHPLTPQMRSFNKAMSEARVSVEWLFSDIAESFKFIDYKKNLKLGMSAVGKQYKCSFQEHPHMYGNTTSNFFEVQPPSLLQYLA